MINRKFTPHGFEFGAATVEATCSDDAKGWAVVSVRTAKETLQIYVTKTGKVRVRNKDGEELKP